MSINEFLTKNNTTLIWDVIMDEDVLKNRSKDIIINVNNLFNRLIKDFYENEKNKFNNLIEMNKRFITIILNYINKYYPSNQMDNQIKQPKELITTEDIQQNRLSQFEKELNIKQKEFTNAMALPVPPTPKFNDTLDVPISEMNIAVKQMLAQRNYDVEVLHQSLNKNNADSWLKSQETSIKNEKIIKNMYDNENVNTNLNTYDNPKTYDNLKTNINNYKNQHNNKIKYIKIDDKDLNDIDFKKEAIDLNKKQLTWSDNNITIEYNDNDKVTHNKNNILNNSDIDNNIFKKFKIIPENTNKSNNSYDKTMSNEEKMLNLESETKMESKIENLNKKIDTLNNKMDTLNNKMDFIIKLLENKNIST